MKHREYNKNWISHKVLNEMSEANLTQFLTEQSGTIPFTNFALNDLHELAYANNLVQDFTTRGRKKKEFKKSDLLKLCQKLIKEQNLDEVYDKFGTVTMTINKPKIN
jgi:hypothetical protein